MSRPLKAAVVDSSALLCVMKNEPAAPLFFAELAAAERLFIGAVTLSEVLLAAMSVAGVGAVEDLKKLVGALNIVTVDYTAADVAEYIVAATRYHIKATPPGLLNMGDLFSFQLARKMQIPLFFQGLDFLQTPVQNAMQMQGYIMTTSNRGVPTVAPG